MSAHAAAPKEAAAQQTPAVLKLREVDFSYRSSIAPLSCTALHNRVVSVFRALGAREDVKVEVHGCDAFVAPLEEPADIWQTSADQGRISAGRWSAGSSGVRNRSGGREQFAQVRVRMMMPIEVTPEVLEEIRKDKARRELVSRVTGDPAAVLNDPIIFPAQRQLVTLSRRTIRLEPQECELIEQMSRSVFRRLGIRVVRGGRVCDRGQISHIPPQLTVEALMPVMPEGPKLEIAPAAGDAAGDPGSPAASETVSSEPEGVAQPE